MIIKSKRTLASTFHREIKTYRKTGTVKAIQIHESFTVDTPVGTMYGKPEDYLCEGIDGEKWPVKKAIFEKTYEVVN